MIYTDCSYRLGKAVSLVIPRPPEPRSWFDPSRIGGSKTRVLSQHVLAWREIVAGKVDNNDRPQLIGTVLLSINTATTETGVDAHARRAIVDVMRCCRVIANQDQIVIDTVEPHELVPVGMVCVVLVERLRGVRMTQDGGAQ